MARLLAYPVFFAAMAVLVLAAGGATADLVRQELRRRAAWRDCERLRLEQLAPHARPEMIAAVRAELERGRERLQQIRAEWPGGDNAPVAKDRLVAYAELVAFGERCRAAAERVGTAVAKDARFGFASHASEAPAESEVPVVLGQMRDVERVLGALFKAGPERVAGVWRENPATDAAVRSGGDWCALELVRSVQVPGLVRTRVVRVAFVGTGACLRRFLNRLAAESALVVRDVAAAVPESKSGREKTARGLGGAQREFTVTLESVTVEGASSGTVRDAPVPVSAVWREPAGRAGHGGGFELFAPAKLEFDGAQKRWVLPSGAAAAAGADDYGATLVAVRRMPYRWRLAGVVGAVTERRALLEETATRRTVLLGIGERESQSGVALEALDKERLADGGRGVRAVLRDHQERGPVVLTTTGGGPERLLAVLRLAGREEPVVLGEGATVQVGGWSFKVGRFRAVPESVEVSRTAADTGAATVRWLQVTKR
jgi:hypothetical protein